MSDSDDRADWGDLTDTQQQIIDTYAKNPGITNDEVSEKVGCAVSYPSRVKSKHSHLIDERREYHGIEDSGHEPERRTRPAESWDELTENQQKVVDELLKEDDPTDPDRTHAEIADSVGVHPTYVGDVIRKYEGLIERIAAEQEGDETAEETVQDMSVTGAAASPMTASPDADTQPSTTLSSGGSPVDSTETTETTSKESPPSLRASADEIEDTVPIPRSVLDTMIDRARTTREMAQREAEMTEGASAAQGRLVAAEQWESSLENLLELADAVAESDGDVEEALESLDDVPEPVVRAVRASAE